MKPIPLIVATTVLFITGCATTMETQSDHDPSQSFSGYSTFAWIADQPMMVPPAQVARVSPLNRKRIEDAIESELAAKGFRKSPDRAEASFVVSYTIGARYRVDVRSFPAPYTGPWRWGWPYYWNDVDARMYTEGTLAIDVFDGATHQPVWHGWASKRILAQEVEQAAQEIPLTVAAILKDFPPR
jgi:hypothetical protein